MIIQIVNLYKWNKYKTGDIIKMILRFGSWSSSNVTLRFYVNNNDQGIACSDIIPHDSVSLISFNCTNYINQKSKTLKRTENKEDVKQNEVEININKKNQSAQSSTWMKFRISTVIKNGMYK